MPSALTRRRENRMSKDEKYKPPSPKQIQLLKELGGSEVQIPTTGHRATGMINQMLTARGLGGKIRGGKWKP